MQFLQNTSFAIGDSLSENERAFLFYFGKSSDRLTTAHAESIFSSSKGESVVLVTTTVREQHPRPHHKGAAKQTQPPVR